MNYFGVEIRRIHDYYYHQFKRDLREYFIGSTWGRIPEIGNVNRAYLMSLDRERAILMPILFFIQIVFQKTVLEMHGLDELKAVTKKLKHPVIMEVVGDPDAETEKVFGYSGLAIIRPDLIDEQYKLFVWECSEALYKDIELNLQCGLGAYEKYAVLKEECSSRACRLILGEG